jgi:glycolate oxidase FAD binding subunit
MEQETCHIDEFGPLPVLKPKCAAELGEVVRRAAAEDQAVYPLGGRTMLDYGLPPMHPGIGVDLRGLTRVIDYPARDMTVTVEAGIPIAQLQALLAKENQRLPVDVPRAEQATLGGALATNASGPRRHGFGTLRDYVIGISVIDDAGREVKAGGRVVKNVAGYDLCKLHVGSLGTLGIITQVTLKLRPVPEEQALVILRCQQGAVGAVLDRVHGSRTRPVCVDLLNASAAKRLGRRAAKVLPEAPWVMVVGFEDNRASVGWQVQQLIKEFPAECAQGLDVRIGATTEALWSALVEGQAEPEARLSFQANLLPSATADFCQRAATLPDELDLQAHAGSGIVIGHAGGALEAGSARGLLQRLAGWAGPDGNVVVLRCPAEWKSVVPVWGIPRGDQWLMRAVKQHLDPRGLFNPGRFVGGI